MAVVASYSRPADVVPVGALLFFSQFQHQQCTNSHNVTSSSSFKFKFSTLPSRRPCNTNAKRCLVSLCRTRHCLLGQLTRICLSFRVVHSGSDTLFIQVSARFPPSRNASFERLVRVGNSIYSFLSSVYRSSGTGMNTMPRKKTPIPPPLPQEPGTNGMFYLEHRP